MAAETEGASRLNEKVAVITGAASGIGAATAEVFVARGARVVVADVSDAAGEAVAERLGDAASYHHLDVTSDDGWDAVMQHAADTFGRPAVLVNCAGVLLHGSIVDTSLADWQRVLDINLKGTFYGCRHAVRRMKNEGGSIINMSSVSAIVGSSVMCAYDASKGGVSMLTKTVALFCAEKGYPIRCNAVNPGVIETPMVLDYIAERPDPVSERESWERYMPVGGMGRPDEVGRLIAYLAADESRLITGAELVIDGGERAG